MQFPGVTRGAVLRLLAAAMAVGVLADDHNSRVAYAQTSLDPVVAKARAEIARGRYDEAERLLKPEALGAMDGPAALELGLLYQLIGRRAEADALLDPIANLSVGSRTSAAEYARIGRAARALNQMFLANDAYGLAEQRAPGDPTIQSEWGELFLETHDNAEAAKSFTEALKIDPDYAPAQLGLARALLDENPPGALTLVRNVLARDPESVPARLLLAEIELDRSNRVAAKAEIAKAKAVNPRSLDVLALEGAVAYLEDRAGDFQAAVAAALAINSSFAGAYRVPADLAAANYRFEEAVALNRKALGIDPDDLRTHAALGIQLLRTGDEEEARVHLEKAFDADPFNTTTKNLLDMMDRLAKFDVLREGNLVIKFDPAETPVMREFVGPLAERALAVFQEKYQFTPRGPILIEMFPRHDDFAVRTVGMPGMTGALGACFGRVVTIDSPKARRPGEFNWEPTLWHELGHVFTLQLSNQRVPRWLTEGISVYEEKLGAPDWGREGELAFAAAYGRGEHMTLRELNAGFTNPEKISLAYYEASLLTEHIVLAYGHPALRKLLVAYGEGKEGEAALKDGLGVGIDTLQAGFDKLLRDRYGPIVKAMAPLKELEEGSTASLERIAADHPDSYVALVAYGDMLSRAGRIDEAYRALERAAELVPMATGSRSPHALMANIALERGDRARAIDELEALLKHAHTDLESARLLAKELEQTTGNDARLMAVYKLIGALDPFDAANHSALGRLMMKAGDPRGAAREFRAAIASGAIDTAAAHCDLAESYAATGDQARAKKEALAAIEIAPGYTRAQDLLLKLIG